MTDRRNDQDNETQKGGSADSDPWELFESWFAEARTKEINDSNAMSLATVDQFGLPNVRVVLMKELDRRGCVFYTNLSSTKGTELQSSHKAAVCFHWKTLRRSVRLRGRVERVTDKEADDYFGSRARTSQLGAWASKQSRPLRSRFVLLKEVAKYGLRFGLSKVPRPEHWSGFRLLPDTIEFCREGQHGIHDRDLFSFDKARNLWSRTTLQP